MNNKQRQLNKVGDLYLNPNNNAIMLIISYSLVNNNLFNCYISDVLCQAHFW